MRKDDVTPAMIRLYDSFTHVSLDRRALMDGLARLTGSAAAAAAALPLIEARAEAAPLIAADDKRLTTSEVRFAGAAGDSMSGYYAYPSSGSKPRPAVVVIHENRGLNGHIRDVARRIAIEGFVALAPDFLSPVGGTPADEDAARTAIGGLDVARTVANGLAAAAWLAKQPQSTGKVGMVGFCWGGGMVNRLAIEAGGQISAGVAYYGPVPGDLTQVARIRTPLLLHYAGEDARINAGIDGYRQALVAAKADHSIHVYEGVQHAFNNDTSTARYNKQAADLAWGRTIAFFRQHLKGA